MHTISARKKMILAMLMALTLLLSSCALVVKDEKVDAAQEVIRLGDQVITKADVLGMADYQLQYNAMLYSAYGMAYDPTDPAVIESAKNGAVESYKQNLAVLAKGAELKLDQLTEEELADVKEHALENYNADLETIKTRELADSGLEGEALDQEAVKYMEQQGVTLKRYEESERNSHIAEKVRKYVTDQVTVTDEEIKADYDSKVETDKTTYAENAGAYANRLVSSSSAPIYYVPAGVRRVKQILIGFKQEDKDAISAAQANVTTANSHVTAAQQVIDDAEASEEDKTAAQARLADAQKELEDANAAVTAAREAAFANIDAAADEVLASLDAGADWDQLMAEKNEDPGMQSGVNAEKGYPVAAGMTAFDTAFVDAVMALEKIGDHSGKIRGDSYGYYIIRYEGDEKEGPVDYESVKEALSSSLLTTKQTDAYNAAVEEWVAAAPFKLNLNALND